MRITEIEEDDDIDVIKGQGRHFLVARPSNTPHEFLRFSAVPAGNRSYFGLGGEDTEDGPDDIRAEFGYMTHEPGVSMFQADRHRDGYRIRMPLGVTNHNFGRTYGSDETAYLMGILSFRADDICKWLHDNKHIPTPELVDQPGAMVAVIDRTTKQPVRSDNRSGNWWFDGFDDRAVLQAAAEKYPPDRYDLKVRSRQYLIGHDAKPLEIYLIRGEPVIRPLGYRGKRYMTFELGSDGEYLLDTSKPFSATLIDMERVYVGNVGLLEWLEKSGAIKRFCSDFLTYG